MGGAHSPLIPHRLGPSCCTCIFLGWCGSAAAVRVVIAVCTQAVMCGAPLFERSGLHPLGVPPRLGGLGFSSVDRGAHCRQHPLQLLFPDLLALAEPLLGHGAGAGGAPSAGERRGQRVARVTACRFLGCAQDSEACTALTAGSRCDWRSDRRSRHRGGNRPSSRCG
jgi:hypothetical protein